MAKVFQKKVSKAALKKSSAVAEMRPDVVSDDEEDFHPAEDVLSSEEDCDDERKRQKLLEAISALGGKRKKKLGERSEPSVQISEFSVKVDGEGDKIDLSDLIGTMEKTSAVPAKTKKQLKSLQRGKKTVECPLSKQETERIQRDVAFQNAATYVTRWKSIVKQNQRAEQLVFPLNQEPLGPKPMERVVSGWKAQTPLEQEIFAVLSANKQPINDPILTPAEEVSIRAMSLEEAKIRRAELQKARALQSYYEAKAQRERKIKSKKYHKVQNKAKRKEFLKQFDEMVKTEPTAALEELNKIELARMQERMSLKHQNSGKWAKSKAIMAKYDDGARKAMQQQLEVNKELTQKLVTSLNNNNNNEEEEEEEEAGDVEMVPDLVNDAEQGPVCLNPWMRGMLSEEPTDKEMSIAVDLTAEGPTVEEEEENEVEETEEEVLLREFDSRRKLRQAQETFTALSISLDNEENQAAGAAAAPDEEEELTEFTSLFLRRADIHQEAEKAEATADVQLEEDLIMVRTLEDVELLSQEKLSSDEATAPPYQTSNPSEPLLSVPQPEGKNRKRKRGIELKEVLTKGTKVIQVPLTPTMEDMEDSEKLDQSGLIREAFAGDDVITDFLQDKRKQEDVGKPKVVDLTLPGWGEWAGTSLKPSRSKRRRFGIKMTPPPPRKDQHLPSVIMTQKRSSSFSLHQVSSLPFPFQNHSQFESTIRSPLGRTWNTEQTVKKISKPKVVTQLGAIIEPMAREELLKDQKQGSTGRTSTVDLWIRKH
ncbi:U3 small nucleolar RNA-associated protein 14 homolog A [Clinocottus analis]|uniref:U3 small nucleolar RNA-associated protein 14 homolog A n=1 Tax=Clinocottus analis TaxID=304258 RepID=UPI0035C0149C